MKIETKFNIGDEVYSVEKTYHTDRWQVIGPMIIGHVRVEITDSPGLDGEAMFDNYKPQKGRKEQYMCVETGIGTGALHNVDRTFYSRDEACAACDKLDNGDWDERF